MEAEFLAWLKNTLPQGDRLLVGLGDDAAVLDWRSADNCVVTSDLLAEGTHFRLGDHSLAQVGRKLAAVNLSDLAAMAADPVGIVVSLLLPSDLPSESVREIYAGMLPLCEEFGVVIAGGDTNVWNGRLVLSATAFGVCTCAPLTRNGATVGDAVLVTGSFGGSLAGHHVEFTPRIRESILLNTRFRVSSMMDVSDGLALDAWRIGEASNVGVAIALASIPISTVAESLATAEPHGRSSLERALGDGEDFELLFTLSADEAARLLTDQPLPIRVSKIGTIVADRGLWTESSGPLEPLEPRGYLHGS